MHANMFILLSALAANVLLGLLVIMRDSKSATNRLFFIFVAAVSIWSFTNYLSYKDAYTAIHADTLLLVRLVLCFAVVLSTAFFFLVLTFPQRRILLGKRPIIFFCLLSSLAAVDTLSPFTFKAIELTTNSNLWKPVVGPGIGLFAATVVLYDIGGLIILARKMVRSRGEEHTRRFYLLVGMGLMFVTIIGLNFVLPTVFSDSRFIPAAPFFILPFVMATSYAIVKHRLLDIRTAAARGLAYLFSLAAVGLVYGVLTYLLINLVTHTNNQSNATRAFYIGFALLTSLVYPFVKKYLDKVTNRIFFRESYDTEKFLNALNEILVNTYELDALLSKSANLIGRTLKADKTFFVIDGKVKDGYRVVGSNLGMRGGELAEIIELFNHRHADVVTADELISEATPVLHDKMSSQNIGIIVQLVTSRQHIGYIFIGIKQSGDAYSSQDSVVLGLAAHELAIGIQNALRFEEIQNFNLTLQARINDATKKLRRANERLKELDETKDDFISMASHQLRTPLTSVKGYISMVLEGDAGKITKMEREMLGQAFFSSQRMVYLIADLLNVSRLKTGKFVIEPSRVNLATMVGQELSQLKETAASRNLTLRYDQPTDFPDMQLDETKTRQVIMNFVDNAIYYTPAGGSITVRLIDNPSTVELRVEDNGIGVAKSDQPHLFTKFYRAGNARKARPDGTGLGLFMAKKVIIAEGGSVIFESEQGKGSTFGFVFSKSKLASPVSGPADAAAHDGRN